MMNDVLDSVEIDRSANIQLRALSWLRDELHHLATVWKLESITPDEVLYWLGLYMRGTRTTERQLPKNMRCVYGQAFMRERIEGVTPLPFLLKGFQRTVELDLEKLVIEG